MSENVVETDAVVIGAGPVGLFTVFQCGMAKIRCHVIEALDDLGGQCVALYPEKPIYDVPAHPTILAGDLIERLRIQSVPFHPVFHLGHRVIKLTRQEDKRRWLVETDKGVRIAAPAVIIAAGAGAFGPNRPPLDGLQAYEGTSVFYMVTRREAFRGRKVIIAGGGDSAVDWAISLSELADVKLIHRRAKFRCAPESAARLDQLAKEGKIELVVPYQLHGLTGNPTTGELSSVEVADLDGGIRSLPADVLLPFFGLATELGPIAEWGLDLERHTLRIDQSTSQTNLPGIFAVGDVCTYPGKMKLILTGFAEAAQAAQAAFSVVHPGEALHFEHSTTTGVPGVQ